MGNQIRKRNLKEQPLWSTKFSNLNWLELRLDRARQRG